MNDGSQLEDSQVRSPRDCTAYGEEWGLFDLLTCQEDTIPKQKLRALKINSAIDVGCGDTKLLCALYHMLGIQKCVGVERMDVPKAIEGLNEACKKNKQPIHDYISFYDNYLRGYNPDGEHIQERMTEGAFKEHIFYVEHQLDKVDLPDERYGLVVMSNVLHYLTMERCKALLEWTRKSVDAGGWLYLRFKQNAQYSGQFGPPRIFPTKASKHCVARRSLWDLQSERIHLFYGQRRQTRAMNSSGRTFHFNLPEGFRNNPSSR